MTVIRYPNQTPEADVADAEANNHDSADDEEDEEI
jgi:hypothetical protein